MTKQIKIKVPSKNLTATVEFSNESPKTVEAISNALPITGRVNTWGEEIYFDIGVSVDLEDNSQEIMEIGETAYWPSGAAFCIFFGPTPASIDDRPRAVGPVNPLGKIIDIDPKKFLDVKNGEEIILESSD
ncbi:MAG: cyclophilin-like fold protein [Candidatus Helarchaeota archaeon]